MEDGGGCLQDKEDREWEKGANLGMKAGPMLDELDVGGGRMTEQKLKQNKRYN